MSNTIPYKFTPREYQLPFFREMDNGTKRAVLIRHRRTGKDKSCFNYMVKRAVQEIGNYFYIFPTYSQGKKALRDNIDNDGFRTIDHIPEQIIENKNGQDMMIKLVNGSTIQIVGTEGRNIDRLVGTNPKGVIFSEYALQNPRAWDLLRPILSGNGGWAVFNSTPRGKNHLYDMYTMAEKNPKRFCSRLTADQTGIIDPAIIQEERDSGMDEDLIQQEYYCSFDAAIQGAYYATAFRKLEEQGRIKDLPYEPLVPVMTFRDLGISDHTSIWFVQISRGEIRLIDYYENAGEDIGHYNNVLKLKDYEYSTLYLPHDGDTRSLQTGMSIKQQLYGMGWDNIRTVPRPQVKSNAIEAVRAVLPKCWFDKRKCEQGINALKSYRKEYDEKNKTWRKTPLHDRASHGADAFSYLALTYNRLFQKPSSNSRIVVNHN